MEGETRVKRPMMMPPSTSERTMRPETRVRGRRAVTRDDDADAIAVVNEPGWSPNDVARVSRGIRASRHRPAAAFRRVSAPFLLRLVNPRKKTRGPHRGPASRPARDDVGRAPCARG